MVVVIVHYRIVLTLIKQETAFPTNVYKFITHIHIIVNIIIIITKTDLFLTINIGVVIVIKCQYSIDYNIFDHSLW